MVDQTQELVTYFIKVVAISVRMGTLWLVFPFFSFHTIPIQVRLAGIIAFSVALVPAIGGSLPQWITSTDPTISQMFYFLLRELVIGLGMGLVARTFYTACLASAEWVGMQMGFTVASVFNPSTDVNESPWGSFHGYLGLMVFMAIGGHLWCLQALIESYQINADVVLSNFSKNLNVAAFWIEVGSGFFLWMIKLSGPMVAVILLLQMGMGVLSKFVPQINLWTMSIPVTIGVGVFVFTVFSPMYGDALDGLFSAGKDHLYLWLKVVGS